jgi:S-DNA-T family DNA segregation ATPase FtsK/SpoIIIE
MNRSLHSSNTDYQQSISGLLSLLRAEFLGVLCIIGGALLFASVFGYDPNGRDAAPLLYVLMGWTAPLFAVMILVLGCVLLLGQRAGYWSAEALVGAELLLLGLALGAWVAANRVVTWTPRLGMEAGGLVGWALGSLAVAGLDRPLAGLLAALLVGVAILMLIRYTPLIFLTAPLRRWLPFGQAPQPQRGLVASAAPPPAVGGYAVPTAASAGQVTPTPAAPEAEARPKRRGKQPAAATASATEKMPAAEAERPARSQGVRPPVDLLVADAGSYANADVALLEQIILKTLADFNVPARIIHVETGPTVTQFGIEPLYIERNGQKRKVPVRRIVGLADDLALALSAHAVRMEAPVPGRPYVGLEVPNPHKSLVSLRGIMESAEMRKGGIMALPLGRNTAGAPVVMDLTKAPHMLIAGSTGSGKSVCINTIVTGLLMQHGPESLRFVMVDPKMVELPGYNGIPHLYGKVITDVQQVMGALAWLLIQMDDRYQLFKEVGVRNIESYNAIVRKQKSVQPLPYIVLVIDELADLMMTAAEDIERQICRLAQMARATGIHLILATQRPSTDVVTGLIKANFPTRISFAVTSQIDSRVVLDTPGAETLLGRGDMLLMRPDAGKLARVQGCYVADDEIGGVVAFWKKHAASQQAAGQPVAAPPPWNGILDQLDDDEDLVQQAIDMLAGMRTCSTSMLQRRLNLGHPKAARLMEELAARGLVGPDLGGGRGREVVRKGEDEELFGEDG